MSAPLRQLSAAQSFKQDAFKQDTPLVYTSTQEQEALEAANMASPLKVPLSGAIIHSAAGILNRSMLVWHVCLMSPKRTCIWSCVQMISE